MKLSRVAGRFVTATEPGRFMAGLLMILNFIASCHAMSVLLFLRTNFGTRMASITNMIFGVATISLYTGMMNVILSSGRSHLSYSIEIAYYVLLALCVYHRIVISRREKRGVHWHSYFPGQSLIRIPGLSQEAIAQYVEPAVLIALALVAGHFDEYPMRLWLIVGGISLFVHEQLSAHLLRERLLDELDVLIEARNRSAALAGRPVAETQGVYVAKSNRDMLERNPELRTALDRLPEDLKGILDPAEAA